MKEGRPGRHPEGRHSAAKKKGADFRPVLLRKVEGGVTLFHYRQKVQKS